MNPQLKELQVQVAELQKELKALKELLRLDPDRPIARKAELNLVCHSLVVEDAKGRPGLELSCDEQGAHLYLYAPDGKPRLHLRAGPDSAAVNLLGGDREARVGLWIEAEQGHLVVCDQKGAPRAGMQGSLTGGV